jgi:hypothetical protein
MLGLQKDSINAYNRFVKSVRKNKLIWGLKSKDGWAIAPSNDYEDTNVMPFWSHRAYAERVAIDEWKYYQPTSIAFDEFIDCWLKGMSEDGYLAGIEWNAHLIGKEIEPIELARDLLAESGK